MLFRWPAVSFCHWPSDTQLYCFQLLFSELFSNHSKWKQLVRNTDRWYLVAQNQVYPVDAKRQVSLFWLPHMCGTLIHTEPTQASCGQTHRWPSRVAANGYSQGMAWLFAFCRCHNAQVFWILMKPFTASFAGLKYSASDILFCSHFSQV